MKKFIYLPILLLTLFVSVNKVNADEKSVYLSDYYDLYEFYSNVDTNIVNNLISFYTNNLSSDYDYYAIYYFHNRLTLTAYKTNVFYYYSPSGDGFYPNGDQSTFSYYYDYSTSTYTSGSGAIFVNFLYYSTNSQFIFADHSNCLASINSRCYDIVNLPLYSNLQLGVSLPQYIIKKGYVIPTYISLSTGSYVNGPIGSTGGSGLIISDIFTNPIQALQSVWDSIVSIFNLIGEFIALIPSPLKEFLIASFMLAIILGLLKVIL